MRLFLFIIASCVVGTTIGLASVEIRNRQYLWYPERELAAYTPPSAENSGRFKANPNAKAYFPETEHNFGVLRRDQTGSHNFVVENQGTVNLLLEVESKSCTCTDVKIENKIVKPGDKTNIVVFWNAEKSMTTFSQTALILTNDPDPARREVVLAVKGQYTSPIVARPANLQVGDVTINREKHVGFRLLGLEKTPLEIKDIQVSNKEIFEVSIEPGELTEDEKASQTTSGASAVYKVNVLIKPGLPSGQFQERLLIHTNYDSEPTMEYFVRGLVKAGNITFSGKDFVQATGALNMGKTLVNRPLQSTLGVRFNEGGTVPELEVVKVEPEFLKVDITRPGGETDPFFMVRTEVLSTTPCYWNGPEQARMGVIEFKTNLPDAPTIRVPVQFLVEAL